MGRFMIAHLNNGGPLPEAGDGATDAFDRQRPDPGRAEACRSASTSRTSTATRSYRHGGDTVAFHSDLHLFLNDGVGLLVSFNSAGQGRRGSRASQHLVRRIRRPLFPGSAPIRGRSTTRTLARTPRNSQVRGRRPRRSFSSFISVTDLISQTEVGVDENGAPVLGGALFNGLTVNRASGSPPDR